MDRFTFELDTVKRIYKVVDKETESVLTMIQSTSPRYFDDLSDSDCDRLVEFANDFQDNLSNATLSLELRGDSTLLFEDNNFPDLSGGIYLRECVISGADLHNASLTNVHAQCTDDFRIEYTTLENFKWEHGTPLRMSHCCVTNKYPDVRERATVEHNEWFMNNRVDGEMW